MVMTKGVGACLTKCLVHSKVLTIRTIVIAIKYLKLYYKQTKCPGSKIEVVSTDGTGIKAAKECQWAEHWKMNRKKE